MKKCEREERLIESAQKGNAEAFGDLVRHYEKFVFNIALSYMSNYDDAFDVAQDAFIKAWRRIDTFKGDSAFSTWLYRICSNTAKDALVQRNKAYCEGELEEHIPDRSKTPEESAIENERAEELRRALNMLEPHMREMIILREFEELSYSEISEHLGLELGTVKSRLNRARERLREILSEQNSKRAVKRDERRR